jgi:hypothetical protein
MLLMASQAVLVVELGASRAVLLALARRTKVLRAVLLTTAVWLLAMVAGVERIKSGKMLEQV